MSIDNAGSQVVSAVYIVSIPDKAVSITTESQPVLDSYIKISCKPIESTLQVRRSVYVVSLNTGVYVVITKLSQALMLLKNNVSLG